VKKSKKRTLAAVAGLAAVVLIAIPVAKEYAARLAKDPERAPPQVQIKNQAKKLLEKRSAIVIPDDEVGFRLPPALDQNVQTYDFEFRRQTDSRGFPNHGKWPERADIVFLGDSLIAGEGVGIDGAFVTLTGNKLSGKSAINLGMPGAGLERQYRIFRKFGAELEPRLVVVCFYVASDLTNDTHFLEWLEDSEGRDYNAFRLSYSRRKGEKSRGKLIRRLQNHVYYDLALSIIEPRMWGDRQIIHRKIMPGGTQVLFSRNMVQIAKRDFSGSEPEFENFRASLDQLQRTVDAIEADLAFVMMPSKEELFAVEDDGGRGNAATIITQELEQRGIPFLDLYPILKGVGEHSAVFFGRDPHMNRLGNEVVANAFIEWIRESEPND
jgi:hypothetical protein